MASDDPSDLRTDLDETLRAIFAQAPDAIVTTDAAGIVTAWNPAAERITGWAAAKAVGRAVRDVHRPAEHTERGSVEGWFLRKNGNRYWSSGTCRPLYDSSGEVRGHVQMFRDARRRPRGERGGSLSGAAERRRPSGQRPSDLHADRAGDARAAPRRESRVLRGARYRNDGIHRSS